jgi:hypothetical protein
VEGVFAAMEASDLATWLRRSRWTYPAVNTAHIFGIALLFGAIVPMDLRLAGLWGRRLRVAEVVGLLRPVAATGAGLAVLTGALLFSVQATDYAGLPLFWVKISLVTLAVAHALAHGGIADAPPAGQRRAGFLSLALWAAVITCGRGLGYL